jgi:hypothetical protein
MLRGQGVHFSNFSLLLDRSQTPVKSYTRGLALALVTVVMLGESGCGPDNETEVQKLAKTAGDPGAPDPKSKPAAVQAPPTSQADYFKRQMEQEKTSKKGYPGAR